MFTQMAIPAIPAIPVKQVRTLEERLRIIEEVEKNPSEMRINLAKRLGLPPSTLNSIIAKKNKIKEQADKCGASANTRKTIKKSTYSELENVLFAWYQRTQASGYPVDGSILRKKSLEIAATMGINNFQASNGWISRFKLRHSLVFRKPVGDSAAVQTKDNATDLWFERLPELLKGYQAHDIYNADETGLFFNCLPDRMLSLIGESCNGGSLANDRLTVLLCTNIDGSEKRVPVVIGNNAKPQGLENIKKVPVTYYANSKSWITRKIFSDFLSSLDESFESQNRKILLFVDTCSAHSVDTSLLRNVKVIFYPPNWTSAVHRLDLEVIKCFKNVYRKQLVQRVACSLDAGEGVLLKINILDAIHFIVSAWQQVTQNTIRNCFVRCGNINKNEEMTDMTETDFGRDEDWLRLRAITANLDFDTYASVDQELATCGVEDLCDESGIIMEKVLDGSEVKSVQSFKEALGAFKDMKAFVNAHNLTEEDQKNISNIETLLLSLNK